MKWIKQDYKGDEQVWYSADVVKKYTEALKNIVEVNKVCADCGCYTSCGVCGAASEKPYQSYNIANNALKESED